MKELHIFSKLKGLIDGHVVDMCLKFTLTIYIVMIFWFVFISDARSLNVSIAFKKYKKMLYSLYTKSHEDIPVIEDVTINQKDLQATVGKILFLDNNTYFLFDAKGDYKLEKEIYHVVFQNAKCQDDVCNVEGKFTVDSKIGNAEVMDLMFNSQTFECTGIDFIGKYYQSNISANHIKCLNRETIKLNGNVAAKGYFNNTIYDITSNEGFVNHAVLEFNHNVKTNIKEKDNLFIIHSDRSNIFIHNKEVIKLSFLGNVKMLNADKTIKSNKAYIHKYKNYILFIENVEILTDDGKELTAKLASMNLNDKEMRFYTSCDGLIGNYDIKEMLELFDLNDYCVTSDTQKQRGRIVIE